MSSASALPAPRSAFADFFDKAGMLVVLAILFLGCSLFVENFLSWRNLQGLSLAVSMTGMVACTMLFCLAAGDFDLSISSVVACAGVLAAVVMNQTESITLGVAAGLGIGALVGVTNGYVVAKLRINALITTLATMQIVRGFGFIISDGKAVGILLNDLVNPANASHTAPVAPASRSALCRATAAFRFERTRLDVCRPVVVSGSTCPDRRGRQRRGELFAEDGSRAQGRKTP